MNCLDTYALIEIANGNPSYSRGFSFDFIITDITLAEFYWVLLRDYGMDLAESWLNKLSPYSQEADKSVLINAMKYRHENKKQNLSFFDCVGYIFSTAKGFNFVTGDKEFKDKKGVLFIK
mgnify:CR=1 FL=1